MQYKAIMLADVTERIRITAKVSQTDWCDLLRMNWSEYQMFRAGQLSLDDWSLEALSANFQIPVESIQSGSIDFVELATKTEPKHLHLPERYEKAAYGRRRSSISSVQFLEDKINWRLRMDVVQKFKVPESSLQDPFKQISVLFMVDLCEYLARRGLQSKDFMRMGAYNYETSANTLIGRFFSSLRNPGEVYEYMLTESMKMFESNCTYTLKKLTATGGVFEVHSNREVASEIGVKDIGSPLLCAFKAGHTSIMPCYIGLPPADVRETSCVHKGDSCCRFEFTYSSHPNGMPIS